MDDIEALRKECLAAFEGRDYEPGGAPVFAWHVHHGELIKPLREPIANRVDWICAEKAAHEIPVRLRWLRPVLGAVPAAFTKAWVAYDKAWAAYDKAWAAYDNARVASDIKLESLHATELPRCPWDGKTLVFGSEE